MYYFMFFFLTDQTAIVCWGGVLVHCALLAVYAAHHVHELFDIFRLQQIRDGIFRNAQCPHLCKLLVLHRYIIRVAKVL